MPRNLFSNYVYSPVYTGYVKLISEYSPIAFYSGDYAVTHPAGLTRLTDYFSLPGSSGMAWYASSTNPIMGNGNFIRSLYHYGSMVNPLLSCTATLPALSAGSFNGWISGVIPTVYNNFWQLSISGLGQSLFQNGESQPLEFNGVRTSFNFSRSPGTHMVTFTLQAPANSSATTTTGNFYMDGTLITTLTNCPVPGTSVSGAITSGMNQPQAPFTITVAALSLHSIELTQAQVTALWNAGQGT